MDIYIKPKKKVELSGRKVLHIKDVADVVASDSVKKQVEKLNLVVLEENIEKIYLISVTDIIKVIAENVPNAIIHNVGEIDSLVYCNIKKYDKTAWNWVKVAIISLMLFVGSSTAIMAFHTDSQVGQVFIQYHKILFNEHNQHPYIINIPYSIGLAIGIIIFFNHFGKKRFSKEPTPIEVSMETYEKDVEDSIIEILSKEEDD